MPKRIALVGHCGPDASYLLITVRRAVADAQVVLIDDEVDLDKRLESGVDLLLINRELIYGFSDSTGVDLIQRIRPEHPNVKMMLVSNYSEAHEAAVKAGALPGFGKRELGSTRVSQLLRDALGDGEIAPAAS